MIRALETFSFGLFLIGWLLLGSCGTWTDTTPFWIGAPFLWLSALCGFFTMHRGLRGQLSRGCTVMVMIFTGYILWRALRSDVIYLARADIVFCATAFIAWVMIAARFEKPRHRFAMLGVWSLLIFGNLALGLWQQHRNPNANPLGFLGASRDLRDAVFGGFFPNSNHLCGFLELTALPLLAVAVFGRVHSFVRMLCGLVFVAGAVAVAMSTSRGGLSFGVGILFFGAIAGILHMKRGGSVKGRAGSTPVLFVALALVCCGVGWLTWNKLETAFGKGGVFNNLNGRTELWSRAVEQWQESPVIGTGARSYEYYEPKYRDLKTQWITWDETDINARWAHNDWVQTLADYGLIGLLLAAAVLGFHCWKALAFVIEDSDRAKREGSGFFTDHRGAITLGALCGMIAFAIHCMADFHMHVGTNAVLAAAVLGLMANPGRPAEDPVAAPAPARPPRMAWRVATTLAACVPAAVLGAKFFPWAWGDYHLFYGKSIMGRGVEKPGEFFLAGATFKIATDSDPENFEAWEWSGFAEAGAAQLLPDLGESFRRSAYENLKIAHHLYPQNADISVNAARMLDALGKYAEAEDWFAKALQWNNGSRLVHWYYADHLKAKREWQKALDHYWPILHKHKVGGIKRTTIQRSIDYCERKLREEGRTPLPRP